MKRLFARKVLNVWIPFQCILFLGGCNKVINWGKTNFAQASRHGQEFVRAAQAYIRSAIVYYQFTTEATFDVIFLTDSMRMLYVDYYKECHGLNPEQEMLMRKRLINENKYFISFYVVAAQKEHKYDTSRVLFTGSFQKQPEILGAKDSPWNIRMMVGREQYQPESIRVVDLPMEFRTMFGNRLDQFSTTYLVRFPIQNDQGRNIFESAKKYNVTLLFTSPIYQTDVIWRNMIYTRTQTNDLPATGISK